MIGLAQMAWKLACERIYSDPYMANSLIIRPRAQIDVDGGSANAEYYRIIDRLSRGEAP